MRRFALLAFCLLLAPAAACAARTEVFTWVVDPAAESYRLYACYGTCWRPDWSLRAARWALVAESSSPAFVVVVPDQLVYFVAANVYAGGVEVVRVGVGWMTVPGAETLQAPTGLHVP